MKWSIYFAGGGHLLNGFIARLLRFCAKVAAMLCLGASWLMAQVPPPPNDICAGAETIPGIGPFPWVTTFLPDISGATNHLGDPPSPECFTGPAIESVWYVFTPMTSGVYAISASVDTRTTVLDTFLAIFTSANGCTGPFVDYACNDDTGGAHTKSGIATNFAAGTTYYIVLWESYYNQGSGKALQLRVTKPEPPPNDTCAGAWVIPGDAEFPYLTPTNDIFAATTTGDPPAPSCLDGQLVRSVWYKFTPAKPGTYTLSTCAGFTRTLVNDTFMTVYRSSSGCAGPLTEVACINNSCGSRAAVTVSLDSATSYLIVVSEYFLSTEINTTPIVGETALQLRVEAQFPPVITLWESRPEGFYFQFTGTEGQNYTVLASPDLASWESLGPAIWLGGNLFEFTDPPAGWPHRFYRVQSP